MRRLRDQRQEAINRLAEADHDMRRARDILNELSPRAEELRLQAASAEEYRKVADGLRTLQGSLAKDSWRKAMVQLRKAVARQQAADHKRSAATQTVAEFEPLIAGAEEEIDRLKKPKTPVTVRHILSHTSGMPFKSDMEQPTLDHLTIKDAVRSYALTPLQ